MEGTRKLHCSRIPAEDCINPVQAERCTSTGIVNSSLLQNRPFFLSLHIHFMCPPQITPYTRFFQGLHDIGGRESTGITSKENAKFQTKA